MEDMVAIITARGGSKRIPRKNIKEFCGKPIIQYSINAAIDAGIFSEIMVSTDDSEIADIARRCGGSVPFLRSKENSNDHATTADVIYEVLKQYMEQGRTFQYACCIYPTAPFLTGSKLKMAMELLKKAKASTVLPVVPFSFPPQRGVVIRNEWISMENPEYLNTRSQDLEKIYHDCGQFYCVNVEEFLKEKKLIGNRTLPFVMNEIEVQDIDTISDWKMAEFKYHFLSEENPNEF